MLNGRVHVVIVAMVVMIIMHGGNSYEERMKDEKDEVRLAYAGSSQCS